MERLLAIHEGHPTFALFAGEKSPHALDKEVIR